jgi:hypothetical protein
MKSKFFVILAVIALLAFVVALDHGQVWAQQGVDPADPSGAKATDAKFSDDDDKQQAAGGDGIGAAQVGRVLQTIIPDVIGNGVPQNDFLNPNGRQVDAVANRRDGLFGKLIANRAVLRISIEGDQKGKGVWKVWYEDIAPNTRGAEWEEPHFNKQLVQPGLPQDLDGLQLFGGWVHFYSEEGDPAGPGVRASVRDMNGNVYITHDEIVAAVTFLGWNGSGDIDLDGLMAWDVAPEDEWSDGDTIIFSIRDTRPGGGNWDGGEIVVLPHIGQPASAFFLVHGGHIWNTGFDVHTAFGVQKDEVDAIEAGPTPWQQTPTLTGWGLIILVALLIGSTVFVILRRRKAAVPA